MRQAKKQGDCTMGVGWKSYSKRKKSSIKSPQFVKREVHGIEKGENHKWGLAQKFGARGNCPEMASPGREFWQGGRGGATEKGLKKGTRNTASTAVSVEEKKIGDWGDKEGSGKGIQGTRFVKKRGNKLTKKRCLKGLGVKCMEAVNF